jgi:sulfoxide reductase heme-binding subunit YedZ
MRTVLKSLVFGLALVPLGWLAFTVVTGRTSPNPAQDIINTTGIWALRFLLITLAITPLRRGRMPAFRLEGQSPRRRADL